jgi:hypothetical protein
VFKDKGKTVPETIKLVLKSKDDESSGKAELEKIAGFYDLLAKQVILDEEEEETKKKLAEAIADPSKFKDKPTTPPVTEVELKGYFGDIDNLVDKPLADK